MGILKLFQEMCGDTVCSPKSKKGALEKIKPNVTCYNVVIQACAAIKNYEKMFSTFDEMKLSAVAPDVDTYRTIFHACNETGQHTQTIALFHEMKAEGLQGDETVYNLTLAACEAVEDYKNALELLNEMKLHNYTPNFIRELEHENGMNLAGMRTPDRQTMICDDRTVEDMEYYNNRLTLASRANDLGRLEELRPKRVLVRDSEQQNAEPRKSEGVKFAGLLDLLDDLK